MDGEKQTKTTSSVPTTDVPELVDIIARAAIEGKLLLFVGTGFSRAVLNWKNKVRKQIPGWLDLLDEICKTHDLRPSQFFCVRSRKLNYDCPGIASEMARKIEDGAQAIKKSAAKQTLWIPRRKHSREIGTILLGLNPSAIVTTNYDEILEGLLGSHCESLSRCDEVRIPMREKIAVWHFHGRRDEPKNIVLTREDYLEFFRPGNYAQSKLSHLLHDYFTLFVGYSLSDINLLAALDWAQNVYQTTNGSMGYQTLGDSDSFSCRQVKNKEQPRRVIIEYSRECKTPEAGATPPAGCAVIRTSDVIKLLMRINESGKSKRLDLGLPTHLPLRPISLRKRYNEDDVNALLSSPSELKSALDRMATEYHANSGNRNRIIETLREAYRRARPKSRPTRSKVTSCDIDKPCFLVGMLFAFPIPQLPTSCRIRFLEELERFLCKRTTAMHCPRFCDKLITGGQSAILSDNLAWLRQVSLYGGFTRCACSTKRCLKHLKQLNSVDSSSVSK